MTGRSSEPRLRGHHFVCLQFFHGEGYSDKFVENLARVVKRATDSPAILVAGADDVCAACPGLAPDGTCADTHAGEQEVTRIDRLAWQVLGVAPGDRLSLAEARRRLASDAISAGRWRVQACAGCSWEAVCERGWGDLLGGIEEESRRPE